MSFSHCFNVHNTNDIYEQNSPLQHDILIKNMKVIALYDTCCKRRLNGISISLKFIKKRICFLILIPLVDIPTNSKEYLVRTS